jgi:hypothetical protein
VHLTPEQEAQLSQIASHAGTDTERLVKDAALRLLERDARFRDLRKHKVPPLRFAPVGMTELLLRSGRDDRVIAGRHRAGRPGGIHRRGRDGCGHRADA